MKVKYLANLIDRTVNPVNVASETEKTYKVEGGVPRHKQTTFDALFSTEIDAQIHLLNYMTRRKNEHRSAYQNAQKDLRDALVRFNLEQCEVCNEFHTAGEEHDCAHHPF